VWEEVSVFQQSKLAIAKFLHQLKMVDIASHRELPACIREKYLANCINTFAQ
jgi:hypothetical protein